MTVIYADNLFLINTLIDYLLLLITGRLSGFPLQRKRYFFAALLGGFYAVVVWIPSMMFLGTIPGKALIWILLARIAFGKTPNFIKITLLLGLVSSSLAGIVLVSSEILQNQSGISFPEIHSSVLITGLGLCALVYILLQSFFRESVSDVLLQCNVSIAGNTVSFMTLLDTGNQLRNPLNGQPILIVSMHALEPVLPNLLSVSNSQTHSASPIALLKYIRSVSPNLCPNLIPYQALGVSSSMLLTLRTDCIKIGNKTYPHAIIALTPTPLAPGVAALWGGQL